MAEFDIEQSEALAGTAHGFFGSGPPRSPGEHQFGFGGPGDPDAIRALRAEAAHAIAEGARLVAPHQVHSPDVLTVSSPWEDVPEGRPVGDALVTDRPGIALGIVTADCAPVLLADSDTGVVGAAHAGWRGAQGGVLENTLAAMEAMGANRARIAAAIGPTIAQANYEVDAPFREHFSPEDEEYFADAPMRDGAQRWNFNLPGYVAGKLREAGVIEIHDLMRDTFSPPARYHSYRRSSLEGRPDYGRQISIIVAP